MASEYFDSWEFQKAQDLKDESPSEAVEKLNKYLKEYPRDYLAYGFYASNLITIGKIDEAEKIIDYVEKEMNNNKTFLEQQHKQAEIIRRSILFNRLRINSYRENYKKLYELCSKNQKEILELDVNSVSFYCKSKLGMLNANRRDMHGYVFRQMVEYHEDDFFDHIQKHLADYNSELDERNKNIFVPDFPLNDVLKEIQQYLTEDKCLYSGMYEIIHTFKYDGCGRVDNRLVDYFQVVSFHKTKNIITILPVSQGEKLPFIDLNYIRKEEHKEVKRESAVDKFNRKFRR